MLIKNPFTRPVWIERVHVSLPSELMLADNPAERQRLRSERKEAEARRREEFRANARKAAELNESLERLSRLIEDLKKGSPNNASSGLEALSNEVRQLREKMELDNAGELVVRHSSIRNIRLISERLQRIVLQHCNIDEVEVTDRSMQPSGAREINLRSSLPPGVALQPSSTVAYTAELNVDRSIVFPPAKYTLQFSVNFSFVRPDDKDELWKQRADIYTNTIASEVAIRTSVYSLLLGSSLGGGCGWLARSIRLGTPIELSTITVGIAIPHVLALIPAVLLSAIAILRKTTLPAYSIYLSG